MPWNVVPWVSSVTSGMSRPPGLRMVLHPLRLPPLEVLLGLALPVESLRSAPRLVLQCPFPALVTILPNNYSATR